MNRAELVLTDSGGLQEEAPAFHKPVLVLRKVTERPEGVEAGVSRVIGTKPESIVSSVSQLLDNKHIYRQMASGKNPYGDGNAAERIIDSLLKHNLA
jgi:UDP-N-acetylglucosamine 2-epimerase (non-hydrolysing)